MKYIYTIYKTGNFSRAAKELYLTQPTLTLAVQKVEKQLGMPIFERKTKPISLTEAGKRYIDTAKKVLELEKDLTLQLDDLASLQVGSLNLGGTHYVNSYILPPILAKFHQTYPKIEINVLESTSYKLIDLLQDSTIDLTFNCVPALEKPFKRIPAFTDMVLLAVPRSFIDNEKILPYALTAQDILEKKHLEQLCPSIDLKPFSHLPFIALTKGNNLYERCRTFFIEADTESQVIMTVTQLVTAYHLTLAGVGATFISDLMVKPTDTDIFYFKLPSVHALRHFNAIMLNHAYLSHAKKAFLHTVHQFYPLP